MKPTQHTRLATTTIATLGLTIGFIGMSPAAAEEAVSTVDFYVSSDGDDTASGTSVGAAFASLPRAQEAVRSFNSDSDVRVIVGGGVYTIDQPLEFGVDDGGKNGHSVTWEAAPGASPVISGGREVSDWTDTGKSGIWEASLDTDFDFRQLYVDDAEAVRARMRIDPRQVTWTRSGFSIGTSYASTLGSAWSALSALPPENQSRVELRARASFTDRYSPFLSVSGNTVSMQQPAWDNNTWGWDTVDKPLPNYDHSIHWITNALALLDESNEWYFDLPAKKLYYKPADGIDPNSLSIVAPLVESLVSISGDDTGAKVTNLTFRGMSFEHASWLQPGTNEGFANQQNGTFITGRLYALRDPVTGDLPTTDDREYDGGTQPPLVRIIELDDAGVFRFKDDGSAVPASDHHRLINLRDYPNLPLNSEQLTAWNAANPGAAKTNCAIPTYPNDCKVFEAWRNDFDQSPAAVQIAQAQGISFEGMTFAHLGATALGIGNEPGANRSGLGYGAQDISVVDSSFFDLASAAIVAGGVQEEAHHPSPGNENARLTIANSRFHDIGKDFFDASAILVTYWDTAEVIHNELSGGPYDAIDTGFGWGMFDNGGNPAYQTRGTYMFTTRYAADDPTNNKNVRLGHNAVWDFKKEGSDGGILYNLGSTPGSVWDNNYVMGERGVKLYLDEATRYLTAKNNVLTSGGAWMFANAWIGNDNTRDNRIESTWSLGGTGTQGPVCWNSGWCDPATQAGYLDNRVSTDSAIGISELPLAAQQVIANAGVQPQYRRAGDWHGESRGVDLSITRDGDGAQVLAVTTANLGSTPLTDVSLSVSAPSTVRLSPITPAPDALAPGEQAVATWRVSGTSPLTQATIRAALTATRGEVEGTSAGTTHKSLPVVLGGAVDSALTVAGFDSYIAPQAVQSGNRIALQASGRDIGYSGDEYGTVFKPDALADGGSVTAKVESVGGSFYRTGVAVRNDLSKLADHDVAEKSTGYAMFITEPGWVAFRYNKTGDGVMDTQVGQARIPNGPVWLRLSRSGSTLTAAYSTDGASFTDIPASVPLVGAESGPLDAGVVHSSADRWSSMSSSAPLTTTTAIFSDLTYVSDTRAPVFTNVDAPVAFTGQAYSFQLTASGAPTFKVVGGALPGGLALALDGAITGTPTAEGTFTVEVEAANATSAVRTELRIVVRDEVPASPEVQVDIDSGAVPGLSTGVATASVRNPTTGSAAYTVTVAGSDGQTVSSDRLTIGAGAEGVTQFTGLAAATYTVTTVGDDGSAAVTTSIVMPAGVFDSRPAPWKSASLGGATAQSMGVEGSQLAIVKGRAADISGENAPKTDSYNALYLEDVLGRDDSVQVTVTGQEGVSDFTKSGIIIRDDLAVSTAGSDGSANGSGASSGQAALVLTPTRGVRFTVENGGQNWYPIEAGETTAWNVAQTIPVPVTLKLARTGGTTLEASYSIDGGRTFTVIATKTGFFASGADKAIDAGIVHVPRGGVSGAASTAAFRDFLVGAQITAPAVNVKAVSPDTDGRHDGVAEVSVSNPTAREMFARVVLAPVGSSRSVYGNSVAVGAGATVKLEVGGLSSGDYEVTVVDKVSGIGDTARVTIAAAVGGPRLELGVQATPKKLGGKVYLSVVATNEDSVPVDVVITTVYGNKAFKSVQPGTSVSVSINSKLGSVPAGEATVKVTGVVNGELVTETKTASYGAFPAAP